MSAAASPGRLEAQPITDVFHALVSCAIDERGVYPHQLVVKRGGRLEICALALHPQNVYRVVVDQVRQPDVEELVFGLDRFSKPGQGTEFGDVIAGGWWLRDTGWRTGIIEYQHDPRIVRPWDWGNDFWNAAIGHELAQCLPGAPLVTPGATVAMAGRA